MRHAGREKQQLAVEKLKADNLYLLDVNRQQIAAEKERLQEMIESRLIDVNVRDVACGSDHDMTAARSRACPLLTS